MKEAALQKALSLIGKKFKYSYQIYTDGSYDQSKNTRGIGILHQNTKKEYHYEIKSNLSIKSIEIIAIFHALKQAIQLQVKTI